MAPTLLAGATLIDGTGRDPRERTSVLVEDGLVARIGSDVRAPENTRVIDCQGMTLMPGLTDAHVHFGLTAAEANPPPESYVSYLVKVIDNIRIALDEGFTTVRDAGGLDPAFAHAVDSGQIPGPTILPSGSFLSQTGGHGDQRHRWTDERPRTIPGLVARTEICDGPDAVRRAAREQLRRGATQVKLMASGGVMSPNDPLESLQFTVEEMAAAVHEARAYGKYVMAHCHTTGAMNNALDAGVRSLEHASLLDEPTARRIVAEDAYVIPTLVILEILAGSSALPDFSRSKLELVRGKAADSMAIASRAGARIGSGSDLLGPRQSRRASEIVEKARYLGAMGAIVSATRTNAELFGTAARCGTVEERKVADLILVAGDPLSDVAVLADAACVRLVMKGGEIVKECR